MAAAPAPRMWGPALALFAARVVYAFNWYNVGAVLPLIGVSFRGNAASLGLVLGAFLAGVGIFQIPAGFADLRWGARRTSLGGLTLMGLTSLASAFSTNLPELATLRFFAGVGAAFFFSPALSLIASYFPPGRRGPVIGLYNGGFSLGGAAGLAAGAVAGSAFGWPGALALGGGALLVMVAVNQVVLPPDLATRRPSSAAQLWNAASGILSSRSVWALALALTGFWAAVFIVAQDFVTYASEVHPNWGGTTAATLAAVVILLSFPGGPLGGWLAERPVDRRTWLAIFAGGSGLTVLAIPILGLVAAGVDFVLLGLFDGIAFAVLYVIPSYLPETRGQGVALGIAFLNSVQVLLGSAATVLFGYVAVFRGFTVAWIFAGLLTVALLPLLLWVTPNRGVSPTGVGPGVSTTMR